MINKKELRLGNWFQDKFTGDKFQVILISDDIIGFDYETEKEWQAEPIHLTEETLLKCGMKKDGDYFGVPFLDTIYWYNIENQILHIEYTDSPFSEDEGTRYPVSSPIKYLHTLMNAIYDLTGKEVEYEKD